MYIQPNSTVRLIKNCPIDNSYADTIYFSDATAQYEYFSGLDGITYQALSYIRAGNGVLRVEADISQVYNINYMMFRNTSFENRWFYAFVNSINYINNNVAEIRFTLDVMQSWFIQSGTLEQCYVEREMATDDSIGANIKTEDVGVGEYVFCTTEDHKLNVNTDKYCVVLITDVSAATQGGQFINGVYTGSRLYAFKQDEVDQLNDLIATYTNENRGDAITGIYMVTGDMITFINSETHEIQNSESYTATHGVSMPQLTTDDTLDGYKPKNNKLYTYPYNMIHVDNGSGNELNLRYEFFPDLTPQFLYCGTVIAPPQAILWANAYRNTGGPDRTNTLTLSNYPQCSWANDAYQAYLASLGLTDEAVWRNPLGLAGVTVQAVGSIASAVGTAMTPYGNSATMWGSTFNKVGSLMSDVYTNYTKADTLNGSFSAGNINWAAGDFGFNCARMSINAENAKTVDDYFSLYGYKTAEVKVPNINSRDHWNYVKTVDCKVSGNIPADDLVAIEGIFNAGITFWKHGNEVRDYTLDNTIKEEA